MAHVRTRAVLQGGSQLTMTAEMRHNDGGACLAAVATLRGACRVCAAAVAAAAALSQAPTGWLRKHVLAEGMRKAAPKWRRAAHVCAAVTKESDFVYPSHR
jgi:hypothetical protein